MKITGLAFVAYPSADVPGTRAWYEDVLGLTFAGAYVEDGVERYDEAHLASGAFALMAPQWVGRVPGSAAGVVFEVDDLDDAVRTLAAKGVAIDDRHDGPVCRQFSITDPEGNRVTLHERTAP